MQKNYQPVNLQMNFRGASTSARSAGRAGFFLPMQKSCVFLTAMILVN